MGQGQSHKVGGAGRRKFQAWTARALLVALGAVLGCRGRPPDPGLIELTEARRIAGDLRIAFNKAVDASNRAVMADTDEASKDFAREATRTTQQVNDDIALGAGHLRSLGYPNEIRLLDEFSRHFADYRALDRTVLELAVENTNLKAQGLLFGPARQAADDFRDALELAVRDLQPRIRERARALVSTAVLLVREIQILEAPHIAEADDATMTRMEKEMSDRQLSARSAVTSLSELFGVADRAPIATALAALDRFQEISRQIIALSRRNSNVRSLALSLREKPPLTAACDASLGALQDALAKEGATATR